MGLSQQLIWNIRFHNNLWSCDLKRIELNKPATTRFEVSDLLEGLKDLNLYFLLPFS